MVKHLNAYDRAIAQMGERLFELSEKVGKRLYEAMEAFVNQDDELAKKVIAGDDEIDLLDEKMEMDSLNLISLQPPEDRVLRYLTAAIRISHELERICDYACDIAEATFELKRKTPFFKPLVDLPRMADLAQKMLRKSLKAHLEKDLVSAGEMDDDDCELDNLFIAMLDELTEHMKKNPEHVDQASTILLICRYLERIGDHVVNIAELTIFIESGERQPFKSRKAGSE
jgi:phosphate transport system protein